MVKTPRITKPQLNLSPLNLHLPALTNYIKLLHITTLSTSLNSWGLGQPSPTTQKAHTHPTVSLTYNLKKIMHKHPQAPTKISQEHKILLQEDKGMLILTTTPCPLVQRKILSACTKKNTSKKGLICARIA
jgi:hypothetical protein